MTSLDAYGRLALENLKLQARVAELEREVERYREDATTDPLTGLLNRRGFERAATRAIKRAGRNGGVPPISVILLDLDHFKRLNDTHGHAAGDLALRRVGQVAQDFARETDAAVRWGGEEILVVTENELAGAEAAAERLRLAIEGLELPFSRVTASLGVAQWDGRFTDEPLGTAIQAADRALYEAKAAGRNRVRTA